MNAQSNDRFQRADTIFDAALDLPESEQTAFVDRACADDPELRAEVLQLLRAHRLSGGFLESPAVQMASVLFEVTDGSGESGPARIGQFRIVRVIGQGGMGRVYLGERADGQFEQRVAIKVLHHGAPGFVRRFLEERRILALLQHPGIARLIDGGITEDGVPYFALEYIEGEPIDRYCESRQLSLDARLALFADACDAVTYAHQHLIIHRDLKPSNILVTADGRLKLLDFGIAKLLGDRGDPVDETRTGFRVMTPEFAAPEQIRGDGISTATDVYSLGVLLYMLLSGERPYDVRGKSFAEVERVICEYDPPNPSTRAREEFRRRMRGDLDLIIRTALHKEAERRYQSPAALAQDLQRFREGRAILARPDSARYRVRKFIGRHRVGVGVAALLVLGLVGAASRERVLRNRSELEARKAKEVEEFLVRVFDVADPFAARERDGGSITARELLDRGASRIDTTLVDQPEVQAELRSVLGRVYTNLGLFDRATPLLERSLAQRQAIHGQRHERVAQDMDLLGAALVRQDKYDQAEPLLRNALEQRRRLLGNAHPATTESIEHLARLLEQRNEFAAAEALYREALAINQSLFGDSAIEVSSSLNNVGLVLFRKGQVDEAEPFYRRALEVQGSRLGENHPLTAVTMQNLAQTLQARGNLEEAEAYFRRSLAAKRQGLGDAHPSVTISLSNLGWFLAFSRDRLEEGEALTREALTLDRQIFGERHSYVAQGLTHLGAILRARGEFVEAEHVLQQALDMNRALFGDQHETVATSYGHLAQLRYQLGDIDGAARLMRESLSAYRQVLGDDHLSVLVTMGNLGRLLTESGNHAEAESLLRASLARLDPEKAAHRVQFISAQRTLGEAVLAQGRPDEALPILTRALEMSRSEFGDEHWRTADAQLAYGSALMAKRRYGEAAPLLRAAAATADKNRRIQPRLAERAAAAIRKLPADTRP